MMERARLPTDDPQDLLRRYGGVDDAEIDLAGAALALAAVGRPGAELAPYREHLRALAADVAVAAKREGHDLSARIHTLNTVLFADYGYAGDSETYNDLRNADLMSVIDRRRGLPIALGILYIHAARAQDWTIEGVNFPGHFLLRMRAGGASAILDPFNGGRIRGAEDLDKLIKSMEGEDAELRPEHCQRAGNRQMLLRLQNNIKLRLLRDEKLAEAAQVVERMLLLAPQEPGLWHEAGVLQGKIGNLRASIAALEKLAALSRDREQHDLARQLLAETRVRLN
ncbi:MAG TPA: transglutaminase-like domain-containing protein [Candidatus Acidoferrum sp.]|nr:transglutaminase-like domain-containing protein [Candidatus Acidoferrum sp.]